MLSFVFLGDGPCHEASWHVNDDKNQWWSRRDALVRITGASLWRSPGSNNKVTAEAAFLFKVCKDSGSSVDLQSKHSLSTDYDYSVVILRGTDRLCRDVPVATERNVLRLWKEAFGKASKVPHNAKVGASALGESNVLCSNAAWKEYLHTGAAVQSLLNFGPALKVDTATMEKRDILRLLQSHCSVDFLRTHGLNGPEALILKKKNRDAVLGAYHAWTSNHTSTEVTHNDAAAETPESPSYRHLVDTCKVLLGGILARSNAACPAISSVNGAHPTGYLLFLHEDYPQELPVFSTNRRVGSDQAVPIISPMGAVRDAADEEVAALMLAATSLGMRCVGANLGRTAEFTSKIVTALVTHAAEGRLHEAVSSLPVVAPPKSTHTMKNLGVESRDGYTVTVGGIAKLVPQRVGGWSWDGESNKLHSKKRPRDALLEINAPGNAKRAATGTVSGSDEDRNTDVGAHGLQHHLCVVAWLPLLPSEVTDDIAQRERMHGLIQLVVTTLWRSRLASEASHSEENASGRPTAAKVVPTLYLVFRDSSTAQLTQRKLAIAMANQHMAAPSEYQVLQMLIQLLRDSTVLMAQSIEGELLRCVLPENLSKSARKGVRIVSLTDTTPVCYDGSAPPYSAAALPLGDRESLAQHAYHGECSCGAAPDTEDVHERRKDVVVLLSAPQSLTRPALQRHLYSYVYPDKPLPSESKMAKKMERQVYLGPLLASSQGGNPIAASAAVTVLQHFAYHDRLVSGIDNVIAALL